MNKIFYPISLTILAIVYVSSAQAQEHDDSDHTLEAHRAIPANMLEGPHYRIVDPVVNRFALDEFTVQSDFGEFHAIGQLDLRMLLREIQAIAVLSEVSLGDVASDAITSEGRKLVSDVAEVGRHPFRSAKGIATGMAKRFTSFGRNVVDDVKLLTSKQEGKSQIMVDRFLGVEKSRRSLSSDLHVDPYTINPVLDNYLTEVSRKRAGAVFGTKFLIPKIPLASMMVDVQKLVTSMDFRELVERNQMALLALGVERDDADLLLSGYPFNPTAATVFVELLKALEGVDGRSALIDQALMTDSAVDALFLIESIAMASWYHENRDPLREMLLTTGLPAARTEAGDVVVFAATDFPHWTHVQADVVQQLDVAYKAITPQPHLMLAGNASGEFKREVQDLDWVVTTNVRSEYLPVFQWAMQDLEFEQKQ